MSEDKDSKTEEPTGKRRDEARKKGQVLKSKEVNIAVIILTAAYVLKAVGPHFYKTLFRYTQMTFQDMYLVVESFKPWDVFVLCVRAVAVLFYVVSPVLFAIFIVALGIEIAQVGILITGQPLQPSFEKINPIKGFKRIFALKSLVELTKSIIKTILIGWVIYTTVRDYVHPIIYSVKEPIEHAMYLTGDLIIAIAKKVAGAMITIAFIDYFYQRWEFEKSLKMSKQEVKDEYKQAEGDPHIKGKQKQKMRQMSMGQVRQAVPDSSAVVSNPSHYAVGFKYHDGLEAPIVVAKGRDELAIYIRKVAIEHDIPIFEDKKLARDLYNSCELGETVHPDFFMAIAKIVAQLMKRKDNKINVDKDSLLKRRRKMGKSEGELKNNDEKRQNQGLSSSALDG